MIVHVEPDPFSVVRRNGNATPTPSRGQYLSPRPVNLLKTHFERVNSRPHCSPRARVFIVSRSLPTVAGSRLWIYARLKSGWKPRPPRNRPGKKSAPYNFAANPAINHYRTRGTAFGLFYPPLQLALIYREIGEITRGSWIVPLISITEVKSLEFVHRLCWKPIFFSPET